MDRKQNLPLLAGLLGALFWIAADMLLVGFVPRPEAWPLFSQTLRSRLDPNMAMLMLDGSATRLIWGICLATLSVVLYVSAVPGLRRLMPGGWSGTIPTALLFYGYVTSPVGHAGFGYVGLQAQSIAASGPEVMDAQVLAFNQFVWILQLHWLVSVLASAAGWLLLFAMTLAGRSALARWNAITNPIVLAPLTGALCAQFPERLAAALLGCSSLNIAQAIFFAVALTAPEKPETGL
ncbi:hypothetical protein D2T31_14030 [Sinirhodobacter populi]|uniref:DUF998 domain-containing protein n=1 Tax=Paenirhodobacter populi TaxID=2306993 RepID=A0A443K6U5_9RHOB|nr:DUF6796 family protein [Sinirhodobacter populi]RWR28465.1 hypothetical protein D2T31_14030 [Sinirhodobacter populi]